ncbi:GDSL-type esterase/lipase family protein [Parafilimonas sp.]|uniref:SGNH/GDSL hydrolase family protein n=1 Tax=Parafilimonas sp. TaxID=1969739 RepID=UPI003F7EFA64
MKPETLYLLFIIILFTIHSPSHTNNAPLKKELQANELKPYGRSFLNAENNLELISSAVHFSFSFAGTSCTINAFVNDANGHNYLQYELDGVYQKRLKVEGNKVQSITINAGRDGRHTVSVYKATEATTGPVVIQKIIADNIKPIRPSNEPLIEFIGNSITCGAAADTAEVKCGQGAYHDQHNAYMAYGPRVARALHANYILSSVSGIGVYRTWNMDAPSMPLVYEKQSLQTNDTTLWDFKKYSPKIVSIALGTNDLSQGDGVHERKPFDSAVFVKDYTAFVQLVKSKYPKAIIALLSSPMVNGDNRILLQNCLTAIKNNVDVLYPKDKAVQLFFFQPMQAHGCAGHPNVEEHAVLANELFPFFKKLL